MGTSDYNTCWNEIIRSVNLRGHNFGTPFSVTHADIKAIVEPIQVKSQTRKEIRILGYQSTRESRPQYFIDNDIFLLPSSNGNWVFLKGDGYFDIEPINNICSYQPKFDFKLETLEVGNSEMQYIDYAYNSGIIQHFTSQNRLYLTIRGRKRLEKPITFTAYGQELTIQGVQTEVDAGYESREQIILIEAKNNKQTNETIRQIYYPFRKWQMDTKKTVRNILLLSDKKNQTIALYEYIFEDNNIYESIKLIKAQKYKITL